ncbi:MAG: acyl carrier protein, partial [Myxococcales bacterium]|nr:acyl carrier protein [Myxococcales bacterium]
MQAITETTLDTVLRIIRDHTMYDEAELDLDSDLEGDLGIDSVLIESILADVRQALGIADEPSETRRFQTIRELVTALDHMPHTPAPLPGPAAAAQPALTAAQPVARMIIDLFCKHS